MLTMDLEGAFSLAPPPSTQKLPVTSYLKEKNNVYGRQNVRKYK